MVYHPFHSGRNEIAEKLRVLNSYNTRKQQSPKFATSCGLGRAVIHTPWIYDIDC